MIYCISLSLTLSLSLSLSVSLSLSLSYTLTHSWTRSSDQMLILAFRSELCSTDAHQCRETRLRQFQERRNVRAEGWAYVPECVCVCVFVCLCVLRHTQIVFCAHVQEHLNCSRCKCTFCLLGHKCSKLYKNPDVSRSARKTGGDGWGIPVSS